MAPTTETTKEFLYNISLHGPFTMDEAVNVMKILDTLPGGNSSSQIKWTNAKTQKPVVIGYNR